MGLYECLFSLAHYPHYTIAHAIRFFHRLSLLCYSFSISFRTSRKSAMISLSHRSILAFQNSPSIALVNILFCSLVNRFNNTLTHDGGARNINQGLIFPVEIHNETNGVSTL